MRFSLCTPTTEGMQELYDMILFKIKSTTRKKTQILPEIDVQKAESL